MPQGGTSPSNDNRVIFSIQRTYILTVAPTMGKEIMTCDQRIDIPTIEPLREIKSVVYPGEMSKIIPCIELEGKFLAAFNLEFETNEGITVLPVKIGGGTNNPLENPYLHPRYVLVLPRGATGVKSCKVIHKATGKEVQHNFTFGIMPPPYNYDNALFGYLSAWDKDIRQYLLTLDDQVNSLKLTTEDPDFASIELPKGAGKQTINIENGVLFYGTLFNYPSLTEAKIYNPKITLHSDEGDMVYTLSIDSTLSEVSIDLLTGMITVFNPKTGEILKQFMVSIPYEGFKTLSFENFDDIKDSNLYVHARGARVK